MILNRSLLLMNKNQQKNNLNVHLINQSSTKGTEKPWLKRWRNTMLISRNVGVISKRQGILTSTVKFQTALQRILDSEANSLSISIFSTKMLCLITTNSLSTFTTASIRSVSTLKKRILSLLVSRNLCLKSLWRGHLLALFQVRRASPASIITMYSLFSSVDQCSICYSYFSRLGNKNKHLSGNGPCA